MASAFQIAVLCSHWSASYNGGEELTLDSWQWRSGPRQLVHERAQTQASSSARA